MASLPALTTAFGALPEGFFKSVSSSVIEQLIWRYNAERKRIVQLNEFTSSPEMKTAVDYFLRGAGDRHYGASGEFSDMDSAIKVLNSDYWQLALNATDVYEHMPQKRRDAWRESIDKWDTPEFELETVISTLKHLLLERDNYLSERVDGIFRALSGEHVTNVPEGFGKRMIMYVSDGTGFVDHRRSGYFSDLRAVIAKFMGYGTPKLIQSMRTIELCQESYGEWHEIDGGALRIKVFKKGTAHLEVHPDIAWRLNEILALLHPRAIPPKFRSRPPKKTKNFSLTQNLIPHDVREIIRDFEPKAIYEGEGYNFRRVGFEPGVYSLRNSYGNDKHLMEKAGLIMEACGGEKVGYCEYRFDYEFEDIQKHLVVYGSIPDQKAHQYYATPAKLAEDLVLWCEIDDHHQCIEPSAGQGSIAALMPDSTVCIEASELHCTILERKGFSNVIHGDFLQWVEGASLVDRIVMNPPFSQGRAEAHLRAAAGLLKKGGMLTAIVPASLENKPAIPGFEYQWRSVDPDDFTGVSIEMAMVKLVRTEYA